MSGIMTAEQLADGCSSAGSMARHGIASYSNSQGRIQCVRSSLGL